MDNQNAPFPSTDLPVTRMDFWEDPRGGIRIRKYRQGWTASTRPFPEDAYLNESATFEQLTSWFEERADDWTVRTWITMENRKAGRAWLGEVLPVRSKYAILKLRDRLREEMRSPFKPEDLQIHALNLAYDWI